MTTSVCMWYVDAVWNFRLKLPRHESDPGRTSRLEASSCLRRFGPVTVPALYLQSYLLLPLSFSCPGEHKTHSSKQSNLPKRKTAMNLEDPSFSDGTSTSRKLARLQSVKVGKMNSAAKRKMVEEKTEAGVIWPWDKTYKMWWSLTVICAVLTVITETYAIAFSPANDYTDVASIVEYVLVCIFVIDIIINFHLAYYDENDVLVPTKKEITVHYLKGLFWVDVVGVFPFYIVALAIAGELGNDGDLASYLSLLRLFKLVRLHRMKQLFDVLQYNPHVSFLALTLLRNFGFALLWSHFAACIMYCISKQYDFDPDQTWIGGSMDGMNGAELYFTSLYWSIVTFCSVGYGDFHPVNIAEQIWGMIYMLLNMVAHAWIIGSVTLLIVKQDEKTGVYREAIHTLRQYSKLHDFSKELEKKLRSQLKLDFNNSEISDENVLGNFPAETRRKILRRLYLPSLQQTKLMRGIRQQFVDAFLATCKVEIFGAGDEILVRGSISSDLYLLVAGCVELVQSQGTPDYSVGYQYAKALDSQYGGTSIGESRGEGVIEVVDGEFINAISFFTESPQTKTVRTKTVCKTLTLSHSVYKMMAEDHPGSVGKLLQNLLENVEEMARQLGGEEKIGLPTKRAVLSAGSVYDAVEGDGSTCEDTDFQNTVNAIQIGASLTAIQDLVKMHLKKMKDDHTTRFLFAASRGDTDTIVLMCDQGFNPDSSDYDQRTALMVASMKGNTKAVKTILDYNGNPNLVDMHGSSALYEAARNGHEDTMAILLNRGARLVMTEADSASRACQAVFDDDMITLRRLLNAGLLVDASDYDKRRAVHIAAAEGNLAALKVLVEFGADLTVKDRWGNTVFDEAKSVCASQVLDYLQAASKKT